MHDGSLKIAVVLIALICSCCWFVYDMGYDAALDKCEAEARRIEAERQKQVENYEKRLSDAMAENRANVKRIRSYQRDVTRLAERVRVNSSNGRKADSDRVVRDRLGKCEGLLVEGVGLVEESGFLLPEYANNKRTLESLQK